MKKRKIVPFGLCAVVVLGLAGCAAYKAKPLRKLGKQFEADKKDSFIAFDYDVFDKEDCQRFIDRDVIAQGYQPVQITLVNNTSRYLDFSTDMFSFPCAGYQEVASTVYTSTTKRAVGYGVAGLFVWPLLIPAVVDGVGSSNANKKLDEDFYRKTLKDQIVKPFSTINGLVFVPEDSFSPKFKFTVIDSDSRKKFVLSTSSPKVSVRNSFLRSR